MPFLRSRRRYMSVVVISEASRCLSCVRVDVVQGHSDALVVISEASRCLSCARLHARAKLTPARRDL